MNNEYDIIVIGSGPGGYVAAIRSAQLGYKVAIIEKYDVLGGTCTNVGCIPSKALLDSSEHYHKAAENFEEHGISVNDLNLDFDHFQKRKEDVVKTNNKGLQFLMSKNKIEVVNGLGSFIDNQSISVKMSNGEEITLKANYFIIATGSKPAEIQGVDIDKENVLTSTELLDIKKQPKSLTVIGGGAIGVELASVYARIGTQVTILEYADRLIPNMDAEMSKELRKSLKKLGVDIKLNVAVKSTEVDHDKVLIYFQNKKQQDQSTSSEKVLVSTGRKPYTKGLGLENTAIETDDRGFIKVNEKLRTNEQNIYAIGDVIGGAMLAHKAEEEGSFVAETIDGQIPHINYKNIPNVVYTWPEAASVGITEEQCKEQGIQYRIGSFPVSASARARAAGESEGKIKVISEPKYGEILGVHIIAPRAADLIAMNVVGLEYEVTDSDMAKISYPHPTFSEMLKEAFLEASQQGAINK